MKFRSTRTAAIAAAAAMVMWGCVGPADDGADEYSDEYSDEYFDDSTDEFDDDSSEDFSDESLEAPLEESAVEDDPSTEEQTEDDSEEASTEPSSEESREESSEDSSQPPEPDRGLRSLCADVRHSPPPDSDFPSGVWVRGEVYGLDGGWIWIEGPSLNNGDPLQIPVVGGAFDAPLGINSFGEHPLDRFEIGGEGVDPIDVLPTLDQGPGTVFVVGPDEGPVLDQECFEFPPLNGSDDEAASDETSAPLDTDATVNDFMSEFIAAHVGNDADALIATLHPAVFDGYGEVSCRAYVIDTAGSISGVEILGTDEPTVFMFDTPNGSFDLPDAIPFSAEFTTPAGDVLPNDGHVVLVDGDPTWLTRCGQ